MKNMLYVVLAAACAAVAGCATRVEPPQDPRVKVSPDMRYAVWVTDVACATGTSSFKTVQANVTNKRNKQLAVSWKAQWLDADGIEIDSAVSAWDSLVLQPYETRALKATAPRSDAADVRIYVRRPPR